MNTIKVCYIMMLAALLSSCDFHCSVGSDGSGKDTKTVSSTDNTTLNGAIIKNDIELEVTGVKVKQVFLCDAVGNLLTENKAGIGEKIYLVIKMDTGWVKENDRSYLGASERILTPSGRVIVSADDIFKEYETTGTNIKDSKDISLSALISEADAGLEEVTVQFRVWDKRGSGEVKGKYKFKLKK